jgi:hypothetical protein
MRIFGMATQNYYQVLNYMMASCQHSNPDVPFTCLTFGWNDELLNQFRNFYKTYEFIETEVLSDYHDFLNFGDLTYLKGKLLPLFRYRNQYLLEMFTKYKEPILYSDVDVLISKDMRPFIDRYKDCDLVLCKGGGYDNFLKKKWKQTFITLDYALCNPTDGCLEFLKYASEIALKVTDEESMGIFYDQLGFYYAYQKFKDDLKIEFMDEEFYKSDSLFDFSGKMFYHYNYEHEKKYETYMKIFFHFREKRIPYLKVSGVYLDFIERGNHVCTGKGNIY